MQAEITNAVISALGTILVAFIGFVTQKVVSYLKAKGITQKLENKQYLVDIAVNAVEQIYKFENGGQKFDRAKKEALELLDKNGITITSEELENFIEASVKAMNDGFNSVREEKHKNILEE